MAARGINKLTALQVKKAKANPDKMYKLPDGGNLYLRIDSSGSKYWIFNYTRPGGVSKSMLKKSRLDFDKIEKCE